MEVQLIHEQTYKSQYDLESAVEKFYDSLEKNSEWLRTRISSNLTI